MEILGNFGFEPVLFAAQIINFLILAAIFKKFLYKPILKVLSDREKKIQQGIADAEAAGESLTRAEKEKDEIIKAATLEAEKIIDETKKAGVELAEKLAASAKQEADRIIIEAKTASSLQFENAQKEASNIALDLSRKLLDKVLSEIFTKHEKEKIIQRNLITLKKYE